MACLKQAAIASDDTKHSADLETILVDGDFVYTAADDGKIKVWSKDLVLRKEIQAHDYAVYHLLIQEGKLFSASIDSTIRVWQLPGLDAVSTLTNHEEPVRRLATNGLRLFSGDEAGNVIVFDLKTLASQNRYETVEEVWDLAASGNLFFTVRDRGLSVTEVKADDTSMYTVVKSLQGRAPMVLTKNHLFFCEFGTGVKIFVHKAQPNDFPKVTEIEASSKIITCISAASVSGSERLLSASYDNQIKVFEIPSGKLLYSAPVPSTPSAVAMDTDGSAYVGGPDGYLAKFTA